MILAFLQNGYTRTEANAKKLEDQYDLSDIPDEHREAVAKWNQEIRKRGLFMGGNFTGNRLQKMFGENLCDLIWWENASPRWGWKASHSFPPDMDHIRELINRLCPDVVLTFGKPASIAVGMIVSGDYATVEQPFIQIAGPHPAARQDGVTAQLANMHLLTLEYTSLDECPHCKRLTYIGSHCHLCSKPMSEGPIEKQEVS
jgi:hypothetical protein